MENHIKMDDIGVLQETPISGTPHLIFPVVRKGNFLGCPHGFPAPRFAHHLGGDQEKFVGILMDLQHRTLESLEIFMGFNHHQNIGFSTNDEWIFVVPLKMVNAHENGHFGDK